MNNTIFADNNGIKYRRVDKRQARKIYDNGKEVVFCPCNLRPFGFWNPSVKILKDFEDNVILNGKPSNDFDKVVNSFEYYNCINSETGRFTSFYIAID